VNPRKDESVFIFFSITSFIPFFSALPLSVDSSSSIITSKLNVTTLPTLDLLRACCMMGYFIFLFPFKRRWRSKGRKKWTLLKREERALSVKNDDIGFPFVFYLLLFCQRSWIKNKPSEVTAVPTRQAESEKEWN
jgi:hypothetical protein